ncbi:hypothetical protein [Psychrobacillus soli]|uniref:Uncharacterized protein n=1 Tax=Psychrobacillus soli TaxID=1543965 RepID=A0A544TDV5_9BACI|nr:hypothetical protein [Psychrobacillus soli]TQR15610.1 hypothetical protein FG383_08450 [Psychrobacillus soli]
MLYFKNENNAIQTNAQFVEVQSIKNDLYHDLTVRFISLYVHEAVNSHYQTADSLIQNLNTAPSLMRIGEVKRAGELRELDLEVGLRSALTFYQLFLIE